MRRKNIMMFIIILLIGLFVSLKFIPFGTTAYTSKQTNATLEIPKLSVFEKECCMFSATFKTFSSKLNIQSELNTIMKKYEKRTCNNKTIYYDKKHNITITEYGVKYGLIMNTFFITYDKGEYDNNDCSVVTNPTKLKYQIDYRLKNESGTCYIPEQFKYLNKDGNMYNVYYECFGDLLLQTGLETMNFLNNMLFYDWISMYDVIGFLEYQVENKAATRQIFKDGGSTLYKNKDFSLLKCNTISGNQDIYIGSTDFEYKENYCK
ncbi:MAG: hypothetical protein PHO63_04845 [Bacilli bacterium]|nr:hypothetical protein [Bacilli bacterium]MDD4808797.1 hypothetical protein [Bacilli bacterium]